MIIGTLIVAVLSTLLGYKIGYKRAYDVGMANGYSLCVMDTVATLGVATSDFPKPPSGNA